MKDEELNDAQEDIEAYAQRRAKLDNIADLTPSEREFVEGAAALWALGLLGNGHSSEYAEPAAVAKFPHLHLALARAQRKRPEAGAWTHAQALDALQQEIKALGVRSADLDAKAAALLAMTYADLRAWGIDPDALAGDEGGPDVATPTEGGGR